MKIERKDAPPFIVGKRIPIGLAVGSLVAWIFWLGETFWWPHVEVPTSMVTQATTLAIFGVQLWIVNKYGVTT